MSRHDRPNRRADDRRGQHSHGHRRHGGCGFAGAINRVVSKSRELTGMSRGMVIAAYVLGFVFVPLLAGIVFLVILYWSSFPEEAHRNADRLSRHARRAARKMGAGLSRATGPRPATEPAVDDLDFATRDEPAAERRKRKPEQDNRTPSAQAPPTSPGVLRERFDKLERRAQAIEAFVSSEEYRLQREFDKMDDGDGPDQPRQ